MGVASPSLRGLATANDGRGLPAAEENFRAIAKALWPRKTAEHLAVIGGATDRAARDWLRGKVPPPAIVIAEVVAAMTRPRGVGDADGRRKAAQRRDADNKMAEQLAALRARLAVRDPQFHAPDIKAIDYALARIRE